MSGRGGETLAGRSCREATREIELSSRRERYQKRYESFTRVQETVVPRTVLADL